MQLQEAEDKLLDAEKKLARLREQRINPPSKASLRNGSKTVKLESPSHVNENASRNQPQSKTELVIPAANPKISQPIKMVEASTKASLSTVPKMKLEGERPSTSSHAVEAVEIKDKGANVKIGNPFHLKIP